jgi:two-component system, chemotaxis family, response regulator Rcp1
MHRRVTVLLVEDNPADVRLLQEAFSESPEPYELHTVMDGEAAIDFVHRRNGHADKPRPDLVLLDINLPKRNGHDVLRTLKQTPGVARIPVLMLTSSDSVIDVAKAYDHHVNAYICKPSDVGDYFKVVAAVKQFWLSIVQLPPIEIPTSRGTSRSL